MCDCHFFSPNRLDTPEPLLADWKPKSNISRTAWTWLAKAQALRRHMLAVAAVRRWYLIDGNVEIGVKNGNVADAVGEV